MVNQYSLNELKIEVTQKCELNCIHCSSEANISKTQELSETVVLSLINEAKLLGVKEITFSGGEPLIWPFLLNALDLCNELNVKSVIYTTGNPISDDVILASKLKSKKINKVIISLFGSTPEIHESITRINGSFQKSLAAIKEFISWGIPVGIHFVAMRPNWKELENVVVMANELNLQSVSVLRFVPHGRGAIIDHYSLLRNELKSLRKTIIKLRENSKTFIRLGSPFNILLLNEDINCTAGCDRLIIGSNGKVYPCDAFKNIDNEGNLGSIIQNTLTEVWSRSDYLTKVRRLIAKGLGPECSKCSQCMICKGGCLAQKAIRFPNRLFAPDPDCLM